MENTIQAVVIDGFHKGHVLRLPYSPVISLAKPKVVMVDVCCPQYPDSHHDAEILQYKECFRAVDKEMVLYSVDGKSTALFEGNGFFGFTPEWTSKPWSPKTVLYYGYHEGLIKRVDS